MHWHRHICTHWERVRDCIFVRTHQAQREERKCSKPQMKLKRQIRFECLYCCRSPIVVRYCCCCCYTATVTATAAILLLVVIKQITHFRLCRKCTKKEFTHWWNSVDFLSFLSLSLHLRSLLLSFTLSLSYSTGLCMNIFGLWFCSECSRGENCVYNWLNWLPPRKRFGVYDRASERVRATEQMSKWLREVKKQQINKNKTSMRARRCWDQLNK